MDDSVPLANALREEEEQRSLNVPSINEDICVALPQADPQFSDQLSARRPPPKARGCCCSCFSFLFHLISLAAIGFTFYYYWKKFGAAENQQEKMAEAIDSLKELWQTANQKGSSKNHSSQVRTLEVYEQEATTSNYLYQANLPGMTEMTTCFWFYGESEVEYRNKYLLTIIYPGEELILGWCITGWLCRHLQEEGLVIASPDKKEKWFGWNRHCFTWKANGEIRWYRSKFRHGYMELLAAAEDINISTPLVDKGYLTLLQEQDSLGGNFNIKQTLPGKIAEFNMWDFEMTADQLNSRTCGKKGNIVSWDTLRQKGSNQKTTATFPACNELVTYNIRTYKQERSTSDYLYQSDLPGFSELTICLWYYSTEGATKTAFNLVSLAIPDEPTEFVLRWMASEELAVVVRNVSFILGVDNKDNILTIWSSWNRHCFTWRAGERFEWYADKDEDGVLDLMSSVAVMKGSIRSGGNLVLLQHQDSFEGNFDGHLVAIGKIAGFNMWDYSMSDKQININSCSTKGNVVHENSLKQKGKLTMQDHSFPGCREP